jgi:hypothetical protein
MGLAIDGREHLALSRLVQRALFLRGSHKRSRSARPALRAIRASMPDVANPVYTYTPAGNSKKPSRPTAQLARADTSITSW